MTEAFQPVLATKVQQGVIRDRAGLDGGLDQILAAFERRHSRTTKVRLLTILDDYYQARAQLPASAGGPGSPFRPFVFGELFSKLKAIGWWASSLQSADFHRLSQYFFQEIENRNPAAAHSFRFLLGPDRLEASARAALNLLNNFLAPYVEILVNSHQYARTTVVNCQQIAHSYLADYKKSFADPAVTAAADNLQGFLDQIVADFGQGQASPP